MGLYRDNEKEDGNYYSILGLYRDNEKEDGNYYSIPGLYRDNGKEDGNYYSILGLYRDNGKEDGNYYSILGLYRDNGKEDGNYYSILGLYRDNMSHLYLPSVLANSLRTHCQQASSQKAFKQLRTEHQKRPQSSNYSTLPGPQDLSEDAPTANWPFDPVKGFRIQGLGFGI